MESNGVDRKVELAFLAAFYGGLLTEKQRLVLSLWCEEDLSLAEIAAEAGISRQGVHETLTRASDRLTEMESKLGMAARFSRMEKGLAECLEQLENGKYEDAAQTVRLLMRLDQEDHDGI